MQEIPVFFIPEMVAENVNSFSPSAGKPAKVVAQWQEKFAVALHAFEPLSADDLSLAHDRRYVEAVLEGRRDNGFGDRNLITAETLRYTNGAMLAAAREALRNGKVAVAPASGFHHACYASGGGFCTFNGLMVTALWLLKHESSVKRIAILDLDQHYGNGTDDIRKKLNISGDSIRHFTGGASSHEADRFLSELPLLVKALGEECDLLLYQAGADPHVDDPLGGWMTTHQLAQRDLLVFQTAASMGLPVAWNLAGGYQTPLQRVLDIHNNTMEACCQVYILKDQDSCEPACRGCLSARISQWLDSLTPQERESFYSETSHPQLSLE